MINNNNNKQERKKPSKKQLYKQVSPEQKILGGGRLCLSFKDVMKNLIIQELKGPENQSDTMQGFVDKVKTSSLNSTKYKHPMSPKHRKRLIKQNKRFDIDPGPTTRMVEVD